jgi:hypothetical protein
MIGTEMVDILRIDYACLILETLNQSPDPNLAPLGPVVKPAPPGFMVRLPIPKLGGKSDAAQGYGAKCFCLSGSHRDPWGPKLVCSLILVRAPFLVC